MSKEFVLSAVSYLPSQISKLLYTSCKWRYGPFVSRGPFWVNGILDRIYVNVRDVYCCKFCSVELLQVKNRILDFITTCLVFCVFPFFVGGTELSQSIS